MSKTYAKISLIETRVLGSDEISCHATLVCQDGSSRYKAKMFLGKSWEQVRSEYQEPKAIYDALIKKLYEKRMAVYMNSRSCEKVIIEGFEHLYHRDLIEFCRIEMNERFLLRLSDFNNH
jgi:hypothetical protein